jgi:hypothetical protein
LKGPVTPIPVCVNVLCALKSAGKLGIKLMALPQ